MQQYAKAASLKKIVKIQASWKGYQIRKVIEYLKTTQKVRYLRVIKLELNEIFHCGWGTRNTVKQYVIISN